MKAEMIMVLCAILIGAGIAIIRSDKNR